MEKSYDFSESDRSHVPVVDRGKLHRVIGVPALYAIGYGDVGSSIYYALGITTLYALGAAPLALALAGIVFICTVLTYTEMATAMPESGGSASFARVAFNDMTGFIAGWALLLDYIVTIAISAYTVGPYLSYFWPALKTTAGNIPFALGVIAILFALNVIGIRESTRVAFALCLFDIVTQLTIIVVGVLTVLNFPYLLEHMRIGVANVDWSPTPQQFMKGVAMAMVAYIGIESIAQLAGEARRPHKSIPRAMMLTMGTLLVVYFLISSVALSIIHPRELSTTYLEDPLAGIVAHLPIGGHLLGPWVGVLGATILFVAANAGLVGASRLTFSMGEHFQLPRVFYRLHPKFQTPYISLIVFSVLAGVIIFVAKKLTFIAELYNFGAMLAFALAHLSLIGLRVRRPELLRPFRVPWNIRVGGAAIPIPAVLGFLGTTAVWIDVIWTKPAGRNLGFVWMGVGLLLYFVYRRQQHLPMTSRLDIEKLTLPEHHEVAFKNILVPVRGASLETVQFAAKLARLHGARLTAIHVIEIPAALPLDTFFPDKLAEGDSTLEQAQAVGREYDVSVDTQVLQARSAGESIVDVAKQHAVDLIVVGTNVRSPSAVPLSVGSTLGSTVEYVIKNAPCRVFICTGRDPGALAPQRTSS